MEHSADWLILTCPECDGLFKVPRSEDTVAVRCPACSAIVDTEPPEEPVGPVPGPAVLPNERSYNPDAFVLRKGPEDWERKPPPPKEPEFRSRLARTTDAAFQATGQEPERIRIDWHRVKHGDTLVKWDSEEEKQARDLPRRKRILLTAGTVLSVGAIVGSLIYHAATRRRSPELQAVAQAAIPQPPDPFNLEVSMNRETAAEVWAAIEKFAAAPDIESLAPLIREPERVMPLIRKWYTEGRVWEPFSFRRQTDIGHYTLFRRYVVVPVLTSDYLRFPIALERTPEGFRVDWESFAGYGEMTWPQFRRERPRQPVEMRAIVSPDSYYNRDFPSREEHQCFRLTDKDNTETLFGYAPANGPVTLAILSALSGAPQMHMVLRVRYPENSTDEKQIEILELIQNGWILRDDDGLPNLSGAGTPAADETPRSGEPEAAGEGDAPPEDRPG